MKQQLTASTHSTTHRCHLHILLGIGVVMLRFKRGKAPSCSGPFMSVYIIALIRQAMKPTCHLDCACAESRQVQHVHAMFGLKLCKPNAGMRTALDHFWGSPQFRLFTRCGLAASKTVILGHTHVIRIAARLVLPISNAPLKGLDASSITRLGHRWQVTCNSWKLVQGTK
jgi:hypothetical protein